MRTPDETPTEVIPRIRFPQDDRPAAAPVSTDTMPEGLPAILDRPSLWSPPRRPWRRLICWALFGHFWFPGSNGCLECGTPGPPEPVMSRSTR